MSKPRYIPTSVPAWCVTLYLLLASSLGCITLGLLEGPVAVLATCLTLGVLSAALSLVASELAIDAKGIVVIIVTLLPPAVVVASPHLSDFIRWVVAAAASAITLCLLAKITVGYGRWSEPLDLADIGGYVSARWIAHALWAIRSLSTSAMVIAVAGALWNVAHAHWTNVVTYSVTLAGIIIVAGLIMGLELWLITKTIVEKEPGKMFTSG